jgi:hypothetical protein
MAEVIVEFDSEFVGPDGAVYRARACGTPRPDQMWEGWLEFVPAAAGVPVRTGRETTQPNRDALMYWATGLTTTYIEGALERTVAQPLPRVGDHEVEATPAFSAPAGVATPTGTATPVLDPFHVHTEGANVLRGQLEALNEDQLRTIALAYRIADRSELEVATRAEVISLIMVAADKRAGVI